MHLIGCMNGVIAMSYESGSDQRLREALQRNDTINVSVDYPNVRGNLHEFRNVTRDRQRPDKNADLLAQALRYRNVKDNIRGYLGGQSGGSAFNTIVNPITQQRYNQMGVLENFALSSA